MDLVSVLLLLAQVWEYFHLDRFRGDRQVRRLQPLLVLHLNLFGLFLVAVEVQALFIVSLPDVLYGLLLSR